MLLEGGSLLERRRGLLDGWLIRERKLVRGRGFIRGRGLSRHK